LQISKLSGEVMMVRAFFAAIATAAAALALAGPAAAEPVQIPCGPDGCIYQQLNDDEDWADEEDWDDDEDWDDGWAEPSWDNPLGLEPNLGLCGGVDTAIPFIGVYQCLPLYGG